MNGRCSHASRFGEPCHIQGTAAAARRRMGPQTRRYADRSRRTSRIPLRAMRGEGTSVTASIKNGKNKKWGGGYADERNILQGVLARG